MKCIEGYFEIRNQHKAFHPTKITAAASGK